MAGPSHLARAIALILIVLSPLGAPVVGILILSTCSGDASIRPDGPFAIGLSYCGISRPLEHFYQQTVVMAFVPAPGLGFWGNALCSLVWLGQRRRVPSARCGTDGARWPA